MENLKIMGFNKEKIKALSFISDADYLKVKEHCRRNNYNSVIDVDNGRHHIMKDDRIVGIIQKRMTYLYIRYITGRLEKVLSNDEFKQRSKDKAVNKRLHKIKEKESRLSIHRCEVDNLLSDLNKQHVIDLFCRLSTI